MQLKSEEINKYIRALKTRQKLFENDKLAIYIGKKCLGVMKKVARQYAREATWTGSLPPRLYGRI